VILDPIARGTAADGFLAARFSSPSGAPPEAREGTLDPGVTVVVCTHERPLPVRRLLRSLAAQDRPADVLMVVDASREDETERVLRERLATVRVARAVHYWRVSGPLRGLTRQRNFALDHVTTDLVAFFDDDVVMNPQCLRDMERALRASALVAGVGCVGDEGGAAPSRLWQLRRVLGIVPSLEAGRYWSSGMSTPWSCEAAEPAREGDWLHGFAMMWRSHEARSERFDETFPGYAQGEDLDFSLRMRRRGRLIMLGPGRLRHLPEPAGRPDPFRLGCSEIVNRHRIHCRVFPERRWRDVAMFAYAWGLDTVMLARHAVIPSRAGGAVRQIAGRIGGALTVALATGARGRVPGNAHVG
jgi:GT2 family glycosyltransferase